MNEIKRIDIQDMDKVLKYLTYFENLNNKFYHIEEISRIRDDGTHILNLAPYEYSEEVMEFIKTLYTCNFIQPFDWGLWQDEAAKYIAHPDLLDSADLETVIKLLTTHVRKDRFCDGHLAWVISNGHLLKILKRLAEIRKGRIS